jgi:hypothetical protein
MPRPWLNTLSAVWTIFLVALMVVVVVTSCGAPESEPTGEPVELVDAGSEGIQVTHVPHHRGGTVYCVIVDRGRGSYGRGAGITCDFVDYWQRGPSR